MLLVEPRFGRLGSFCFGGEMSKPDFIRGEEVVFCPVSQLHSPLSRYRGASGIIISRQVGNSKHTLTKKVKSVLVKWRSHRKGVSCFRICGQKRAKSDLMTAFFTGKKKNLDGISRFEEEAENIHGLSYCSDCPLKLLRLVAPCPMNKVEAIRTDGKGYFGRRRK